MKVFWHFLSPRLSVGDAPSYGVSCRDLEGESRVKSKSWTFCVRLASIERSTNPVVVVARTGTTMISAPTRPTLVGSCVPRGFVN